MGFDGAPAAETEGWDIQGDRFTTRGKYRVGIQMPGNYFTNTLDITTGIMACSSGPAMTHSLRSGLNDAKFRVSGSQDGAVWS